ncbi:hypothetical protein BCR59_28160 [Klebsiella pneumoniae]|nr:hypothetical protein BCR59_28160 [Klebsiella pneumoniae]
MGNGSDDPESNSAGENENAQRHQQLMDDLGANVTPAIYYMNKDNNAAAGGRPTGAIEWEMALTIPKAIPPEKMKMLNVTSS